MIDFETVIVRYLAGLKKDNKFLTLLLVQVIHLTKSAGGG